MLIGVPKEPRRGDRLVAATPDTVRKLVKLGYDVCVEKDAGLAASFPDAHYREAGAQVVTKEQAWGADIVTCVDTPPDAELALMKNGATLVSRMNPNANPADIEVFASMGISALAMDAVPRISRAQAMDVRSSLDNIAGYRAVIEAANVFGRPLNGQMTAAGKVSPATVYVVGAGVAGLAAIGTANSMGAIVKASDVRMGVAEQVRSLGGEFVEIPVRQEAADGYARAMTPEQESRALKIYARQAASADIVITTAQVPGKPAPLLITASAVAAMKPGSVIVDMGASAGGNCELTRPGEVIRTDNGVVIVGYTELYGRLPGQASQLYGQNIVNFFKLATPGGDGILTLDMDDEIVRAVAVTIAGRVTWPPPPIGVTAAPPPTQPIPVRAVAPQGAASDRGRTGRIVAGVGAIALVSLLAYFAPPRMHGHFVVFALSVVVGFYVIANVTHSLHTPLMSVTNAISGIIAVGALLQLGVDNAWVQVLALIAAVVASINIFGGFTVTHRMLKMFQRS